MPRYLTKSRFKLALDCASKLYYTRKENQYPDQKNVDRFLRELAKGGIQVGELAKFFHGVDPIKESITITYGPRDYDAALHETNRRLDLPGRVVIAEAAFQFENCFVRSDIIIKDGNIIELYEVKAKSWAKDDKLTKANGSPSADWREYLYDVAFQKWVIEKSTGHSVKAFLTLVNKDSVASVSGLGGNFKVFKRGSETIVEVTHGLTTEDLGSSILINIPVDDVCDWIFANPVESEVEGTYSFEQFVNFVSDHYQRDKKINVPISSGCKKCEFYTTTDQVNTALVSGVKECWVGGGYVTEAQFEQEPLVLELWAGNTGSGNPVQKLIDLDKHLLRDVTRVDFDAKGETGVDGLGNQDRREIQIQKVRSKEATPHIEKEALRRRIHSWQYPLHFIDFETSMVALPWYSGRRPYEGIAFQFSHHCVDHDGRIAHKGQYISFEPGVFPNFEFIRKLRNELKFDDGTIFRYHNHENTYLRLIHRQLDATPDGMVSDKDELIRFIDSITQYPEGVGKARKVIAGPRNMVDLYDVVLKCYYSPYAKGSNSLKQILPSVVHDFPIIREKYSEEIYGRTLEIPSLNYERKIWITPDCRNDPYKTLEPVFGEYPQEELDKLVADMNGLADGGTAMMAFNMLQLSEIPLDQRARIKDALLRYCELDTMAMVMLYEGLLHAAELEFKD